MQWFEAALSWEPWDEPSAYGVTMMLNTMNYRTGVYLMQRIWAPYSERIAWLNDPNAPVSTLDDQKATVFELRSVEQPGGSKKTVAVPVAEINLATGQQEPITDYAQDAMSTNASITGSGSGVSLTAPLYAPGTEPLADSAPQQKLNNYVPDYYRYYNGETASNAGAATGSAATAGPGTSSRTNRLTDALSKLNIPRSMIRTDPVSGVQTVTILNSALRLNVKKYQPSAAQIQSACLHDRPAVRKNRGLPV